MDKNTNSRPLIHPYSYTTPHNEHSSAIYNQYMPSPSSITPQLAYSKTRTGCISRCPCTCVAIFQLQQARTHAPLTNGRKSRAPTRQIKKPKNCQPTARPNPKRRNACTLDGEQSTKSCPKSSVLLNPLIGRLQISNTMRSGTRTITASLSNGLISTQLQYRNSLRET